MSAVIPVYLVGKNVSFFGVTPGNANANGVITFGSQTDYHNIGILDQFEYEQDPNNVLIKPLDGVVANYVGTFEDFTVTLGEIEGPDGSSLIMAAYASYNYMRIQAQCTAPGGSPGPTFAFVGIRGRLGKGLVEGKNAVTLTLQPCGILPYYGTGSPPF